MNKTLGIVKLMKGHMNVICRLERVHATVARLVGGKNAL